MGSISHANPLAPLPTSTVQSSNLALQELVRFVRDNSAFYREHYKNLPEDVSDLEQLPPLAHAKFWAANSGSDPKTNTILTAPLLDGGIFRSGGTTATPKVAIYSRDELHTICRQLAECTCQAGLRPGDRVANLYFNGELYMSYLISLYAWYDSNTPYIQLPIASCEEVEAMILPMLDNGATVAMGMVTTLVRIAEWLAVNRRSMPDIHLLIFSGEPLYPDQKPFIKKAFPNAIVRPMMYGATEAGLIGIPTHDAELDEKLGGPTYVPNAPNMIVEILDEESLTPIREVGRRGLLHVTGVTRRLQPCIRYPTGDVAEWVDLGKRTFVLRGRAVVGFKIGPVTYDFQELRRTVVKIIGSDNISGFQTVARRVNNKDELVFRIASSLSAVEREKAVEELHNEMLRSKQRWKIDTSQGNINPLAVEWVTVAELYRNPKTGKLRDVLDQRV